ncbi:MAG: nucleoside triphosphate pyrophosphohydrolase [Bacteroidales bacterium]|nr:nucleoside triphosphate pyrophosphohydrolase [Bacteroidales bacterium]
MDKRLEAFKRLLDIMDELREKCPWDKVQTFESIRNLTIEEVYELADAIVERDMEEIKKELGDLALHIVFYAKMASEEKAFDITDVLNGICEKLIRRHPHVFGEVEVKDDTEVKQNWEEIKLNEGNRSVLAGVPQSLPALIKASRIQEKVRAVGFDWDEPSQVWDKVAEEMTELRNEIANNDQQHIEEEFGDLFFSLVNAARLHGIDPETALERTNKKFIKRFLYLENEVRASGRNLKEMTLSEMDEIWERAKSFD